jgi:deazaflavin-dependent oxidoreductase (nitroreductase family)
MSCETRNGTRGSRQPGIGGAVGRWLQKRVMNPIRRKGKMMGLGFDALVLTTIGRKSGAERTTPVGWFPGKDGSWLIVSSAAGGPRNPAWYSNPRRPSRQGPDRDAWPQGGRDRRAAPRGGAQPGMAADHRRRARVCDLQQKTDRELPVIRLVPRSG